MRLESLHLERYGHFTGKQLDFSGETVRLHIVHGANEAGKSTLLNAIADVLFGVPARTGFAFLHDYESLRIGATIVSRTGERLAFKRRKGNARTLRTEADQVLPDGALVPFLGDADRNLFERMFGLDHTRLREAGRRMLESDGDLGRSLFEAGSGLAGVDEVQALVQAELDALGTPERKASRKPLWQAAEAFAEAQRDKRDHALRHEEFHAAEKALDAAIATKAGINAELGSIRETRSALERIRRAGPILVEIDRHAAELEAFADVPDLPERFEAERERCERDLLAAENAVATARTSHEALGRELEAIPASDTLTRFATEIGALQTRLGEYLKGVADEPKLARDLAHYDDEIARHIAELGLALDPTEVESAIPKQPLVKKIRGAVREADKLAARRDKAKEELVRAERALAEAKDDLAQSGTGADPEVAQSFLEAVAREGDVAASLAARRIDVETAARARAEALGRLDGWSAGIDALAATPFPSSETIRDYDERRQKLEIEKDTAERHLAEAAAARADIAADLESLVAAGEIATTEAVAAARDARDNLWHQLRKQAIEGRDAGSDAPSDTDPADLVARYETSLRHADELADRRATEAQRIARFAELKGREERVSRQAEADRATAERRARDLAALAAEWAQTWAGAGMAAGTPAAMRSFLGAKDEVLRCLATERQAEAELARAREAEARARNLLYAAAETLGLVLAADLAFAELDQRVRAAAKTADAAWKQHQAAEETARRTQHLFEEKRQEVATVADAMRAFADDWSLLVRELATPGETGPDEATTVLDIWNQIREPVTKRSETARRLEGLRADIARFQNDLRYLVGAIAALAEDRGEAFELEARDDPNMLLQALGPRLAAAQLRLAKRADVARRQNDAARALDAAEADLRTATAALGNLRKLHELDATTDLAQLGRRASEKRRLVEALRRRRDALAETGEGFTEADLRVQCESRAPDAAAAEVASLTAREAELVEAGQKAAEAEASARQALEALCGKTGAAEADARSRDAALAFAGHAERWLLLETARQLLVRAVDRYRATNEHPMIFRASELLTRIAAGAENPITKLTVDYGDGRTPLIVARRADGRSCKVADMSEGTRDQLFLCLRIAAIELYTKEREPLPFIADDLFVTSDEDRVVPGLAALAELGRTTQVLVFTHHRHVVAAAGSLPPGTVRFHALSPADETDLN